MKQTNTRASKPCKSARPKRVFLSRQKFVQVGLALVAFSFLTACNLLNSVPKEKEDVINFKAGIDCPSDVRQTLKDLVAGNALPKDTQSSFACIDHYIERFNTYTKANSFTYEEINAFFHKHFTDVKEFSPSSLREYFRLKNLFLGGGENQITKSELNSFQYWLREASPVMGRMSQYAHIYSMTAAMNLDDDQDALKMTNAITELHNLESLVIKYFPGGAGSRYQFSNLDNLDFIRTSSAKTISETEPVQLLMNLKASLVHPPEESISGEDFRTFVTQTSLILETSIRIKYTKDLKDYRKSNFLESIEHIRKIGAIILSNALESQPSKTIPASAISKLIEKFNRYDLLPFGLQEKSIQRFLPVMMNKVLSPHPKVSVRTDANSDLTSEHLEVIFGAVDAWLTIQKIFLSALSSSDEITAQDLIEKFAQESSKIRDPRILPSIGVMKEILSTGIFLRWHDVETLNFAPRDIRQKFSRYDLLFLSTSFSLVRAVMRGYINSESRRENVSAMTEPELDDLYLSVRELGRDLKFIDSRNRKAPARAFLENNIFTSVSNGNEYVEFHEAMEWFYQVWSAGKLGEKIYEKVPDICKKSDLDIFDRKKLDHECYSSFFKDHVSDFFGHLPTLTSYLKTINTHASGRRDPITKAVTKTATDPWMDFNISLENAYRFTAYSPYDLDSADLQAMALILSYTESLFTNHSRNHDDILDAKDLWATFPILRGFIESASNGSAHSEFIQKGAYSYLISFGEMPDSDSLLGKIKFGAWSVLRYFYKESAGVTDVVKILSSFNLSSRNSKIKAIETYISQNKNDLAAKLQNKDATTLSALRELFYCSTDSTNAFAQKIGENLNNLLPEIQKPSPAMFHKNIEKFILADDYLTLQCLVFE